MDDDDSSSSLTRNNGFSEKIQRGVVTTTTTEDEDDTSSQSNSNNEVVHTLRPEPVSSANTTTDSLVGDGDVGCSPTSTGLNSTTEDADVEDNSSPRSGERITTSSSSSSDGYNCEERPHSQQEERNNSSQDDSSDKQEQGWSRSNPSSFKYARPSSTIFPPFPFGRSAMTNKTSAIPVVNQYSIATSPLAFTTLTPNPFALMRSPPPIPVLHQHPNSLSIYHHDTSSTSRSLTGRSAVPFQNETKSILRPSTLSAATNSAAGVTPAHFSAVRNPFGSNNSSVSSSSFYNNPFNSAFGNKYDEGKGSGQLFGASNSAGACDEMATTTTAPFTESNMSVKSPGANNILRQSKLSNVHYSCTSSENSEASYSVGKLDSKQGEINQLQQLPSTSTTISSEATAKLSIPVPSTSAAANKREMSTLFQNISSSVGGSFTKQTLVAQSAGSNDTRNFVFGSNIRERVTGGAQSPDDSVALPNGVSSTSSNAGSLSSGASTADKTSFQQVPDVDGACAGVPIVHSSTEDDQFQGSSFQSGQTELCFPSSSTVGERKRKLKEQIVTTGEENESNVLQASCRLFVFDGKTSTWIERGRGLLRLNDRIEADRNERPMLSRIIVRTQGSLRLMLNTNVWSGMKVEKPSGKSVRFTANDNGTIKIFVVQSTSNEADMLCSALECRVQALTSYEGANTGGSVRVNQQSSSAYSHGNATPLTSSYVAKTDTRREEIDSSEFDDSDDEVEKSEEDDSPHKKKRLEKEERDELSVSEASSPTTTTTEDNIADRETGPVVHQALRSNIVPSILVEKPDTRSDEEDEEEY